MKVSANLVNSKGKIIIIATGGPIVDSAGKIVYTFGFCLDLLVNLRVKSWYLHSIGVRNLG